MSRTAHKLLSASGSKDAYEIEQSLKFDYDGQHYLKRTPSSASNRDTWTLSFWTKVAFPSNGYWFNAGNVASLGVAGLMESTGIQDFWYGSSYSPTYFRVGTNYLGGIINADPTAWHHIFHVHDSTQASAGDRIRTWVNGVEWE